MINNALAAVVAVAVIGANEKKPKPQPVKVLTPFNIGMIVLCSLFGVALVALALTA